MVVSELANIAEKLGLLQDLRREVDERIKICSESQTAISHQEKRGKRCEILESMDHIERSDESESNGESNLAVRAKRQWNALTTKIKQNGSPRSSA